MRQRAVEVVSAADGPAGLHARELLYRERREPPQRLAIHVHQRAHQHLGQLFARHRRARAGRGLAVLREATVGAVVAEQRIVVVDAVAVQREIDVEDHVERALVTVVLHERGREHGAEHLAVGDVDVLERTHRVEVLGHRHREPRGTQLVHEALEDVEQ